MAVCPNCGAFNNDGSKFCTSCGGAIPAAQPAPQAAPQAAAQPAPQAAAAGNPDRSCTACICAAYYPAHPEQGKGQEQRFLHGWFSLIDNRSLHDRFHEPFRTYFLDHRIDISFQEESARQGQGYCGHYHIRDHCTRPGLNICHGME